MSAEVEAVRRAAWWFDVSPDGFGPLLDSIGDARLVLIGEASHGTHEFYRTRAELTKALILGKGFNVVAVEADWARRLPGQPMGPPHQHRPERDRGPG